MAGAATDRLAAVAGRHRLLLVDTCPPLLDGRRRRLSTASNKRHLILITQTAATVQALVLAILTSTGLVQIWHVAVCALALGVINAFDRPCRQTFVVELVGKEDLPNAIALNSTIFNGSRIFGPSLAGILIAIPQIGPAGAFYINAISFLAVIVGLLMMDHKPRPLTAHGQFDAAPTSSRAELRPHQFHRLHAHVHGEHHQHLRHVVRHHDADHGAGCAEGGRGRAGRDDDLRRHGRWSWSLALASFSGMERKGMIFLGANLLFPPTLIIVALSRSFPLTLAALLVLGFAMIVQNATTNTLLQTAGARSSARARDGPLQPHLQRHDAVWQPAGRHRGQRLWRAGRPGRGRDRLPQPLRWLIVALTRTCASCSEMEPCGTFAPLLRLISGGVLPMNGRRDFTVVSVCARDHGQPASGCLRRRKE